VSSISTDVNAKTVTLILTNTVTNGQAVTVSYTDPTAGDDLNAIQDAVGNDAASFTMQTVMNNTPDFTPPVFATAAVNGNVLTMTYTEAGFLNSTTAPTSAFAVMNGGVANTVTSVAVDVNTNVITLSLANPVLNGQAVTIAYTDPTTGNDSAAIQDLTGNDAVSFMAQSVTNNTLDNVAPVFASAVVNAGVLTMTYTETGLLNNVTALGNAFSVISGDSANPVTAVTVDVNAKTVALTLSTPVISTQVVTVSYTDPTTDNDANAVQDVAGNDAITFAAQNVNNVTAAVVAPVVVTPPVVTTPVVTTPLVTVTYLSTDTRTYATSRSLTEGNDTLTSSVEPEQFFGLGGNR
jgi:uncharacterized repeat protein (TIGR02059 family)